MHQNNFSEDYRYVSQDLMPEISRTFDFTLRTLPEDLKKGCIVAYAFYRAIDNIEDSDESYKKKIDLMNDVVSVFSSRDISAAKKLEDKLIKVEQKKEGYSKLMRNYSRVVGASKQLNGETVELIARAGREMADGLTNPQIQKINTIEDHHRYCHYAAGVVGDMISKDMYLNGYLSKEQLIDLNPQLNDNNPAFGKSPSHDFAVALQLTNNIKDLREDTQNGIYRWPSKLLSERDLSFDKIADSGIKGKDLEAAYEILRIQIDDAKKYFPSALSWVDKIPNEVKGKEDFELKGIKKSWGMALAFSAATLKKVDTEEFFTSPEIMKITRAEVENIASEICLGVQSRKKLRDLIRI